MKCNNKVRIFGGQGTLVKKYLLIMRAKDWFIDDSEFRKTFSTYYVVGTWYENPDSKEIFSKKTICVCLKRIDAKLIFNKYLEKKDEYF